MRTLVLVILVVLLCLHFMCKPEQENYECDNDLYAKCLFQNSSYTWQNGFCKTLIQPHADESNTLSNQCSRCSIITNLRSTWNGNVNKDDRVIRFKNGGTASIKLWWIDYNGTKRLIDTIAPNASLVQITADPHPFMATNMNDQCIGVYIVKNDDPRHPSAPKEVIFYNF